MRTFKKIIRMLLVLALFFVLANAALMIFLPLRYEAQIGKAARDAGIDEALLLALVATESGFRPDAVSPKHAMGLTQVMPETVRYISEKFNRTYDAADLFTPEVNLEIGSLYLADLLSRFPSKELAVAAYNAGPTRVRRWLDDGVIRPTDTADALSKAIPYPETAGYVRKVLSREKAYRTYLSSGYRIPKALEKVMGDLHWTPKNIWRSLRETWRDLF